MFLDEELESIYSNTRVQTREDVVNLMKSLMQTMVDRITDPAEVSVRDWLINLKQIDNGWRLFCKRHSIIPFDTEMWRKHVLSIDKDGKLKCMLGW